MDECHLLLIVSSSGFLLFVSYWRWRFQLFLLLGASVPEGIPGWSPAARTLRNITNNSDMQPANRPANVAHVRNTNGSPHKFISVRQLSFPHLLSLWQLVPEEDKHAVTNIILILVNMD